MDIGLADGFTQTSGLIADCKRQLKVQLDRIQELRTKKDENPRKFPPHYFSQLLSSANFISPLPVAYYDGVTEEDAPDNVSLAPTAASTSASLFTRYTSGGAATALTGASRRTFKNRRREERKRARGRKGSVYEEEYLVSSIGRMIEKLDGVRQETKRLLEGLVRRRMRERASALQVAMNEVLDSLRGCAREVFEEAGAVVNPEAGGAPQPRVTPAVNEFDGLAVL